MFRIFEENITFNYFKHSKYLFKEFVVLNYFTGTIVLNVQKGNFNINSRFNNFILKIIWFKSLRISPIFSHVLFSFKKYLVAVF